VEGSRRGLFQGPIMHVRTQEKLRSPHSEWSIYEYQVRFKSGTVAVAASYIGKNMGTVSCLRVFYVQSLMSSKPTQHAVTEEGGVAVTL
jgi:hypothetical protein